MSDTIRTEVINHRVTTQNLMLGEREALAVQLCIDKPMTSHRLSVLMDISIQNASNVLTKVHRKGYLDRNEQEDPTGGFIFEYIVPIKLKDLINNGEDK